MIYEMLPPEWLELQKRLAKNHGAVWAELQNMEASDAMNFLNFELGTNVTPAHSIKQSAEIWLNAILAKEGTLVLVNGEYSK